MKILDKAAKLEKTLLDKFARRSDVARHPIELYRAILDDIEDLAEPGARGSRVFPYTHITVSVPTLDARQRATAEAVFAEPPSLEERVRSRLRNAGCKEADAVRVALTFVEGSGSEWSGRDYLIDYQRQPVPQRSVRPARTRASQRVDVHVSVLAGTASRARYTFSDARINLGRLEHVVDRQQRVVRQNQVAFTDIEESINQSVSRAHAHITFDAAHGEVRLHDDGSTHGTRVVRGGRTLDVPRGTRGLALRDGDEVMLGQARVRVSLRPRKQ